MSISQFGRMFSLYEQVEQLVAEAFDSRMSLSYEGKLNELYTTVNTLTGDRPTSMADVETYLGAMSRSFYDYIRREDTVKLMGTVDYLRETSDDTDQLMSASDQFVSKYLVNRSANNMTETDEVIATRILARSAFRQDIIKPADTLLRAMVRRPDLVSRLNGHVSVRPDCVGSRNGGWAAALEDIQRVPAAPTSTVYAGSDTIYLVFKKHVKVENTDLFTIDLPNGLDGLIFFGKIEMVNSVDDRMIGFNGDNRSLNYGDRIFPMLKIDNNDLDYDIGSKRAWAIKLGIRMRVVVSHIRAFPDGVSTIALRFKGRFYLTPCHMRAIVDCDQRVYSNTDSWNIDFDSLHLCMRGASSDCRSNVVSEATNFLTRVVNRAIGKLTNPDVNQYRIVLHDFSDIGEIVSVIGSPTRTEMRLRDSDRADIMSLAITVSIICSVCLSKYVQG